MNIVLEDDFATILNMGEDFKAYCSPEFEVPCNTDEGSS